MPKKFFDIIPPQKIRKEKELSSPVLKKKRYFLKSLLFLVILLVLVGFIGSFFFSKVKVEIWPETDVLILEETIIVSGQVFKDERSGSQEFQTSGKVLKEEKAKGVITVYNAYSTSARTLIPSRFVSADGKLFWSVKRIRIPGASYQGGKLVPGQKEVEVIAAEPGEDYNIGASTFALPALAGTSLYTTIYGKSFSSMQGGFIGEVAQVRQEDLDRAENVLIEKLKKESREFLKTGLPDNFILLDELISQEIIGAKSSQEPGAAFGSFNFELKVRSEGKAFNRPEIESFAKNKINSNLTQGAKLQEESLEINYSLKEMDLEAGKLILDLKIKVKTYSDVDLDKIKKAILGKSFKEAKIFLENLSGVLRIELSSWPFLKRKLPENMEKVETILNLD